MNENVHFISGSLPGSLDFIHLNDDMIVVSCSHKMRTKALIVATLVFF